MFSLSSQDDQLPALTGSNRLFQTTTMYIPNSGKSERSTRHENSHRYTCRKKIPIIYTQKVKCIKFQTNKWQLAAATMREKWPASQHARIDSIRTSNFALSNARARAIGYAPCRPITVRVSARTTTIPQFELSTGGTDELVTSSNHQDHADSGAYSAHSSNPLERTRQLLLGIVTMIIAKFVVAM